MSNDDAVRNPAVGGEESLPAIDGYIVTTRLGGGAMGDVYLARNGTDTAVIKILRADLADQPMKRASLAGEAVALASAPLGSAPRLIGSNLEVDPPYLVLEYLVGETLTQRIASGGPLSGEELLAFAVGLVRSLAALHRVGIVHRDVKPDNIMVSDGAQPCFIDFGLSDSGGTIREVPSGALWGSPLWMAQEQVMGAAPGPWTDVHGWALAVLFAAKGVAEFDAPSTPAMLYRVVHVEAEVPGDLDEPLSSALRASLSKLSADRPSADSLVARLTAEPHETIEPRSDSNPPAAERQERRAN